MIGPDQVLYASPPATFFVDDPISAGIFADELSVYQLTTTIVHCLTLQGTSHTAGLAIGAFGLCLLGELLERYLFFTAVVSQKMPGGVTA